MARLNSVKRFRRDASADSLAVISTPTYSSPTEALTQAPTQAPTQALTEALTQALTEAPTQALTEAPTQAPTQAPTETLISLPSQSSLPINSVSESPLLSSPLPTAFSTPSSPFETTSPTPLPVSSNANSYYTVFPNSSFSTNRQLSLPFTSDLLNTQTLIPISSVTNSQPGSSIQSYTSLPPAVISIPYGTPSNPPKIVAGHVGQGVLPSKPSNTTSANIGIFVLVGACILMTLLAGAMVLFKRSRRQAQMRDLAEDHAGSDFGDNGVYHELDMDVGIRNDRLSEFFKSTGPIIALKAIEVTESEKRPSINNSFDPRPTFSSEYGESDEKQRVTFQPGPTWPEGASAQEPIQFMAGWEQENRNERADRVHRTFQFETSNQAPDMVNGYESTYDERIQTAITNKGVLEGYQEFDEPPLPAWVNQIDTTLSAIISEAGPTVDYNSEESASDTDSAYHARIGSATVRSNMQQVFQRSGSEGFLMPPLEIPHSVQPNSPVPGLFTRRQAEPMPTSAGSALNMSSSSVSSSMTIQPSEIRIGFRREFDVESLPVTASDLSMYEPSCDGVEGRLSGLSQFPDVSQRDTMTTQQWDSYVASFPSSSSVYSEDAYVARTPTRFSMAATIESESEDEFARRESTRVWFAGAGSEADDEETDDGASDTTAK